MRNDALLTDTASREQIRHAVQANVVNGVSGLPADDGLGMVSDADTGLRHHSKIVGAVAEGDDLLSLQSELLADFLYFDCFDVGVSDFPRQLAAQFADDDFQRVGTGVVEVEALFQPLGEKSKAAGYQ